jgi:hypothetical protein
MDQAFEEFQKVGKDGFGAAVRSLGDVNKGSRPLPPK